MTAAEKIREYADAALRAESVVEYTRLARGLLAALDVISDHYPLGYSPFEKIAAAMGLDHD